MKIYVSDAKTLTGIVGISDTLNYQQGRIIKKVGVLFEWLITNYYIITMNNNYSSYEKCLKIYISLSVQQ